jgi:hypothetical protein
MRPIHVVVGLLALATVLGAALCFGWFETSDRRFNFAPQVGPDFGSFQKVSGVTGYTRERGYGWLDLDGELRVGTYPNSTPGWESTTNLNLVMRPGPDALASSFAAGPATFALDLESDTYDVWLLTGDWGAFEHLPHEPYEIEVEGVAVEIAGLNAPEFYRHFERFGEDDTIGDDEVYARYVAPRFRWKKVTVPVSDGQLSVRVIGPQRDPSVLSKTGYYAHSDAKFGPKPRFAGALNALLVTRADGSSNHRIERVDRRRRTVFQAERPRAHRSVPTAEPGAAELQRGYDVFRIRTVDEVDPATARPHDVGEISLRATAGEYVPITFAVRAHRGLGATRVTVADLPYPVDVGVVRYALRMAPRSPPSPSLSSRVRRKLFGPQPRRWQVRSGPILPVESWKIPAGITKQFWLTLQVPEEAQPGIHAGTIEVAPATGESTRIPVKLEVLPFALRRPTHLAVGATYFVPVAYSYFGEERFWDRVSTEFEDMRRHNLTTVQLTGMGLENFDGLDRLFSAYRAAGFEHPIYLLESYSALEWVEDRYGFPRESDAFYARYVELFRKLMDEAQRRSWPPLIFNFGDEFTNSASEEFGAELARRLGEIPGIVTAADANGYKEVMLMAPHASIVAFNKGWDGPNGVNQGRTLLNAETVAEVRTAGATPWLVNVGKDRLSNGFYLWKMSRLGVRGKIEWIYRSYRSDPSNPFDGFGRDGSEMVYPGTSTVHPAIRYELMRQGLDDLAYLHTLELLAAKAPVGSSRTRAKRLIDRIDALIDDDYMRYRESPATLWPAHRYGELRDDIIDMVLELRRATGD